MDRVLREIRLWKSSVQPVRESRDKSVGIRPQVIHNDYGNPGYSHDLLVQPPTHPHFVPLFSAALSPAKFAELTPLSRLLSPLSTPPITTITIYI